MRLLCSIKNVQEGRQLHELLTREGIGNELELLTNTDWGSEQYGDHTCNVWIIEEDQFAAAKKWLQLFEDSPDNPLLKPQASPISIPEPELLSEPQELPLKPQPVGFVTFYLIILCTVLFLWENIQSSEEQQAEKSDASPPTTQGISYNNLWRTMLFEDPTTTSFNGIYDPLVSKLKGKSSVTISGQPMFPDIAKGEVWRLFSPALLHSDLFHLFFNMTALLVLGRQMESRLKVPRYLLFILIAGIISNTAQYIVSGPNFIGFSGVLVGMITFIVARQQTAPWEGYQLQRSALAFIVFFIFAMVGLQFVSFLFEVYWNMPLSPRIANTAHLAGGVVGYLLGRSQLFAWKRH